MKAKQKSPPSPESIGAVSIAKDVIFNHDGFGLLALLTATPMTERDAAEMLVHPLAQSGVTVIDWSILSTAHHNCRTRYDFAFDGRGAGRRIDTLIGQAIAHYNSQPLDLLDIVVKHGHENGLEVFGDLRLNHSSLDPDLLEKVPGRSFRHGVTVKKDFRDEAFHGYLCDLVEDLLEKGVDGIVLDFERKTPFFPEDASVEERLHAGTAFMRRVRALTGKPIAVRTAHDAEIGRMEGQDPVGWMAAGLIDVVIPATHNHDPDDFEWGIDRFVDAARLSPRPCRVWPQIWPTGTKWSAEGTGGKVRHSAAAVRRRARSLVQQGADGVYFFNFCCDGWPAPPGVDLTGFGDIFPEIDADRARSEAIFNGLWSELNHP